MEIKKELSNVPAEIQVKDGTIEIIFKKDVDPEILQEQVSQCRSGRCSCCTPSFKERVTSFELLHGENPTVRIKGQITKEEVLKNLLSCAPNLVRK